MQIFDSDRNTSSMWMMFGCFSDCSTWISTYMPTFTTKTNSVRTFNPMHPTAQTTHLKLLHHHVVLSLHRASVDDLAGAHCARTPLTALVDDRRASMSYCRQHTTIRTRTTHNSLRLIPAAVFTHRSRPASRTWPPSCRCCTTDPVV